MFKSLASLGNVEAMAVEGFLLLHSSDFLRAAFNKNPVLTGSVCMAEGVLRYGCVCIHLVTEADVGTDVCLN